jgi:hypothetical protein
MFVISAAVAGSASADVTLLDEHGCHYTGEDANYHCHQGDFEGRTFPSQWRMLMARRDVVPKAESSEALSDSSRLASGGSPASKRP